MAHDFLRERILAQAGIDPVGDKTEPLEQLRTTEWCPKFEALMRNRLLMGRFRYGAMNEPGKGDYDCLKSIETRLRRYRETGNDEHLVDIANLALVEFVCGKHPRKHFEASDDGEHCERAG